MSITIIKLPSDFEERYKKYCEGQFTQEDLEGIWLEEDLERIRSEKREQEFWQQPENQEKISLLRKTYQVLMGVVEVFCRNFSRLSHEDLTRMNKHYVALDGTVWRLIDELHLGGAFNEYRKYPRPFPNLFSAEKESGGNINWDLVRREMSARYGEIETLYHRADADKIPEDPDEQKHLNDVTLYLSELQEKMKEPAKELGPTSESPASYPSDPIVFDETTRTLSCGDQRIELKRGPRGTDYQFLVCKRIFSLSVGEEIEWDEIAKFEEIAEDAGTHKGAKQAVKNAVNAMNRRCRDKLGVVPFGWEKARIKRIH